MLKQSCLNSHRNVRHYIADGLEQRPPIVDWQNDVSHLPKYSIQWTILKPSEPKTGSTKYAFVKASRALKAIMEELPIRSELRVLDVPLLEGWELPTDRGVRAVLPLLRGLLARETVKVRFRSVTLGTKDGRKSYSSSFEVGRSLVLLS